ncbi:MAG TPA: FecR domain-containing protein [Candidatus Sulfotelmatobacter sp.]|jgi:hypothetical protein|nr:FecR domain-containing protein [Candidatus Sulfotelmatobacter sp.]
MKNLSALAVLGIGCIFAVSSSRAIDLKQSKLTQVVNDVEIISAADQSQKNASVNDVFKMPDILKTGPQSRAELVADDETVTRVGANTIFSFDPANRTIDLKQGSLLFHSPHGKGGGTIHTGSATASVLGTTLIITTTPSGGFKVLDLEGSVEVNFLNGLNQKLAPGQMSFVLPGGNQLSPIVVFRLDDLTKNSRLVGGFHNQLASLPLILQQVQKQLAAIAAGKLGDTGLLVGSDGNSQGIQVIDPNTLQSALNAIGTPLKVDAIIDQPSLAAVSTPPQRIFTTPILLQNNPFYLGQGFVGFAAKDIYFDAPGSQLQSDVAGARDVTSTLNVDLSPYASWSEFDFVAAQNIVFNTSTTFSGLASDYNLTFSFIAGNQIQVASGTTIQADVANWQWESPAVLSLDTVSVVNNVGNTYFATGTGGVLFNNCTVRMNGNLGVQTLGDASFIGTGLTANSSTVDAAGSINLSGGSAVTMIAFGAFTAGKDITINGANFLSDPNNGAMNFSAKNGSINVSGSSFNTSFLSLNSGDGILLDGTGQTFTGGANAQASFSTTGSSAAVSLSNADFTHYAQTSIASQTVNLYNVAFNNVVNIFSRLGLWNNGSSQSGYVNDLGGVTYNGTLVNAANGSSGKLSGTGITIGKLP